MSLKSILILDDDPDLLFIIEKMLDKSEFKPICYNDPEKALEYIDQGDSSICMFISDVAMPKMSGLDFLEAVKKREQYKDLPFLILSALSAETLAVNALEFGAVDYIIKPVSKGILLAKIKSITKAFDANKMRANTILSGNVEEKAVEDILAFCDKEGLNGVLKITHDSGKYGIINFVRGNPEKMLIFDNAHTCLFSDIEALEEIVSWTTGKYTIKRS